MSLDDYKKKIQIVLEDGSSVDYIPPDITQFTEDLIPEALRSLRETKKRIQAIESEMKSVKTAKGKSNESSKKAQETRKQLQQLQKEIEDVSKWASVHEGTTGDSFYEDLAEISKISSSISKQTKKTNATKGKNIHKQDVRKSAVEEAKKQAKEGSSDIIHTTLREESVARANANEKLKTLSVELGAKKKEALELEKKYNAELKTFYAEQQKLWKEKQEILNKEAKAEVERQKFLDTRKKAVKPNEGKGWYERIGSVAPISRSHVEHTDGKSKLKKGQMIFVPVELDTSNNQHKYRFRGQHAEKYKKELGEDFTSVTTLTGAITGKGYDEKEISRLEAKGSSSGLTVEEQSKLSQMIKTRNRMEKAGRRGTNFHKAIELIEKGELGTTESDIALWIQDQMKTDPKQWKDNWGVKGQDKELRTLIQDYLKFKSNNGMGKVVGSELSLGAVANIGGKNRLISGTLDELFYSQKTGKYSVQDLKNTSSVGPGYGLQLNILKKLLDSVGIDASTLGLINANAGNGVTGYDVGTLSDKQITELIESAFSILEDTDTAARMKKQKDAQRKMSSGGLRTRIDTKENSHGTQSTYINGVSFNGLQKWKFQDDALAFLETAFAGADAETKKKIQAMLFSTKTYKEGQPPVETYSDPYRKGNFWDKARDTLGGPMSNLMNGKIGGSFGAEEFVTPEGDIAQYRTLDGMSTKQVAKVYQILAKTDPQKATNMLNNLLKFIDSTIAKGESITGDDYAANPELSMQAVAQADSAYMFFTKLSELDDDFQVFTSALEALIGSPYRNDRGKYPAITNAIEDKELDAIGGELQSTQKGVNEARDAINRRNAGQAASYKAGRLREIMHSFETVFNDTLSEMGAALSEASTKEDKETVLKHYEQKLGQLADSLSFLKYTYNEAVEMLSHEGEYDAKGNPLQVSNAEEITEDIDAFRTTISKNVDDALEQAGVQGTAKTQFKKRMQRPLYNDTRSHIQEQVGYRFTRAVALSDYIESILKPILDKVNENREKEQQITMEAFAAMQMSDEQYKQYQDSKTTKRLYEDGVAGGKALQEIIHDVMNVTTFSSREMISWQKQAEEMLQQDGQSLTGRMATTLGPDGEEKEEFRQSKISEIVQQQITNERGQIDFSKQFNTFMNRGDRIRVLERQPIDSFGKVENKPIHESMNPDRITDNLIAETEVRIAEIEKELSILASLMEKEEDPSKKEALQTKWDSLSDKLISLKQINEQDYQNMEQEQEELLSLEEVIRKGMSTLFEDFGVDSTSQRKMPVAGLLKKFDEETGYISAISNARKGLKDSSLSKQEVAQKLGEFLLLKQNTFADADRADVISTMTGEFPAGSNLYHKLLEQFLTWIKKDAKFSKYFENGRQEEQDALRQTLETAEEGSRLMDEAAEQARIEVEQEQARRESERQKAREKYEQRQKARQDRSEKKITGVSNDVGTNEEPSISSVQDDINAPVVKKPKYTHYAWDATQGGYFWLKKDGTFSKERVSNKLLSQEELEKIKNKSTSGQSIISSNNDNKTSDGHITSNTRFNPKGKRRKAYTTDDQGNLIGEIWEDTKDKVQVNWGKNGRQGFIEKHKNESEDKTIADITKILSRKGYNYTKKDGSLNAAGTQVLEKMLQDIYGKGNVGPSDTSNIHIDRVDTIDIDNAVTVNINGGIIKDGSRSSDKGKKDDHTARDNKNASDRASKALDYLKEELKLEEALAKIQNDESKLNERNTLIQQITELKKERELLEHNMSDSELAMYGADAAKLSPHHARRISQIQARQEDKNAAQAAKDAEKAEKDAAKAAKEEAAKIDAEAAEAQAEKEAASKKNLAESNKLLKQKLGYEKELIKIQARVNKLQEDGTESVQADMKKLEERIQELRDLITDTDTKYQTAKAGVTEEEDIKSIVHEEEEHQRKVKDAERRARWAEEDKKAKSTGGEVTVDSSKISQKDKETLREARILQAQLYKAKDGLAVTGREAKALQNKKKNAGTLSGEEQERLGVLLDRKSEYQSIVNDLTKKWDNQSYETDAGWQAARLLKQGKEGNFKLIQKGKSIQFADRTQKQALREQEQGQKQALREYEKVLEEILKKEQRLYEIRLRKASSTNKREINALEAEESILSSHVKLLKQKHEEQKKNPLLQTTGSNGEVSLASGALEANANFESRQAEIEAKAFSDKKGATSIWHQIGDNFQTSIQRVFNYGAAMKVVQSIPQAFKKIIAVSKELDAVMTDLRIVTGYNRQDAVGLMKTYNGLAKQLGATTQEVAKSADTWLRQGYSVADANKLITSTMYLAKLGQIESGQASQYLTSMLKGFKLEASEAMSVVDKLVALDKQYAVTAGGVAEALSRTAVSAQMAGVELDKIAAMVTVISDVSQKSADSVGESMKTLFARYGNVKAGVFEDLTDSSGETTENINDIEKVLNSVGIKVRSSSLEFREMDDVLDELADKWIGLTTVEKNAIATAMAGTRQRENFNIMMENYDEILKATTTSINASGTAEKGYIAVTESVAYQMNQMKNAWDDLALQLDTNPIFVQLTKWGVSLLEILPKIIQYVVTFVGITKSKSLLGGIKNFGTGTINAIFGTNLGFGGSKTNGGGILNRNGVTKDSLNQEFTKTNNVLNSILQWLESKGPSIQKKTSEAISGKGYSEYQTLLHKTDKKSKKRLKELSNPIYEMAHGENVEADVFVYFQKEVEGMAEAVSEATIWQRRKMKKEMELSIQSKKLAKEEAEAKKKEVEETYEKIRASHTASAADKEAAKYDLQEAQASLQAAEADLEQTQRNQKHLNKLVKSANKQTQKDSWKQAGSAALSGVTGGISAGMSAYAMTEGDEEDKTDAALKQGVGTAVGTAIGALGYAIPYVGAFVGPITTSLGGMIGNELGGRWAEEEKKKKYAEQKAAEAEAELASERLEKIQSISSSIDVLDSTVRRKDDWTAQDEGEVVDYVNSIQKVLYQDAYFREQFIKNLKSLDGVVNETASSMENLQNALDKMVEGTEKESMEIMRQLELAKLQAEEEALIGSASYEKFLDNKILNSAGLQVKGKKSDYSNVKEAVDFIKANGATILYTEDNMSNFSFMYDIINQTADEIKDGVDQIDDLLLLYESETGNSTAEIRKAFAEQFQAYSDAQANVEARASEVNELKVKRAMITSDLFEWDDLKVKNSTIEEAIDEVADDLQESGVQVRTLSGEITKEARRMILNAIKEDTRFTPLLQTKTLSVSDMVDQVDLLSSHLEALGVNYEDLLEIFTHETTENIAKQDEYARTLKISVEELRNLVYKANPEDLEEFAHELGYTVDEIKDIKHLLGDYTLGDLFELPSTTIEKYEKLTSLLSTMTSEGITSANTLQTIIDKYPSLLMGKNADGTQTFSMANVQDNILDLFGVNGSNKKVLEDIYAKQFYEQIRNNETFYNAFLDGLVGKTGVSDAAITRLRQFNTFSDEALEAILKEDFRDPTTDNYIANEHKIAQYLKTWNEQGGNYTPKSITDIFTSEEDSDKETAKALAEQVGSDYEQIKQMVENPYSAYRNSNVFETAYSEFIGNLEIEVDVAKDFRKLLGQLKIQEFEQEQQYLQDVLSGLESINQQREKEIQLIKAKQKLEDVRKEKTLRYREGLGFIYEQDTAKIKEAQDEIARLEEEKEKASIQYQIDQLEVQKQTLNALMTNESSTQDLLSKIEQNTSVLSILLSGADVDTSGGVEVSTSGGETSGTVVNYQQLLQSIMDAKGLSMKTMTALTEVVSTWEKFLSSELTFSGEVTVQTTGTLVLGSGAQIKGTFTGDLTSSEDDPGVLKGTIKAVDEKGKETFVEGTFQLGKNGNLELVEGQAFQVTANGDKDIIAADLAEGTQFTFDGGSMTGTIVPFGQNGEQLDAWQAEGSVNFSASANALEITSGDLKYTGDLSLSANSVFTTSGGTISGYFSASEDASNLTYISGTVQVGNGFSIEGSITADGASLSALFSYTNSDNAVWDESIGAFVASPSLTVSVDDQDVALTCVLKSADGQTTLGTVNGAWEYEMGDVAISSSLKLSGSNGDELAIQGTLEKDANGDYVWTIGNVGLKGKWDDVFSSTNFTPITGLNWGDIFTTPEGGVPITSASLDSPLSVSTDKIAVAAPEGGVNFTIAELSKQEIIDLIASGTFDSNAVSAEDIAKYLKDTGKVLFYGDEGLATKVPEGVQSYWTSYENLKKDLSTNSTLSLEEKNQKYNDFLNQVVSEEDLQAAGITKWIVRGADGRLYFKKRDEDAVVTVKDLIQQHEYIYSSPWGSYIDSNGIIPEERYRFNPEIDTGAEIEEGQFSDIVNKYNEAMTKIKDANSDYSSVSAAWEQMEVTLEVLGEDNKTRLITVSMQDLFNAYKSGGSTISEITGKDINGESITMSFNQTQGSAITEVFEQAFKQNMTYDDDDNPSKLNANQDTVTTFLNFITRDGIQLQGVSFSKFYRETKGCSGTSSQDKGNQAFSKALYFERTGTGSYKIPTTETDGTVNDFKYENIYDYSNQNKGSFTGYTTAGGQKSNNDTSGEGNSESNGDAGNPETPAPKARQRLREGVVGVSTYEESPTVISTNATTQPVEQHLPTVPDESTESLIPAEFITESGDPIFSETGMGVLGSSFLSSIAESFTSFFENEEGDSESWLKKIAKALASGFCSAFEDESVKNGLKTLISTSIEAQWEGLFNGLTDILRRIFGDDLIDIIFGTPEKKVQKVDENGNPVVDENGNPVYDTEEAQNGIIGKTIETVKDGAKWVWSKTFGNWFANGTTDAPGGISLINEPWAGGTEAIITPQGTITALPAHSGIVPADLTRNLYKLGEIAPNLIQEAYHSQQNNALASMSDRYNMEDNSINIQTLDAVFQVNESFDFDKFLGEVRSVVNTTKHNR